MLYTLQTENVNINYLARLDFLDLCLLGEGGTRKTRTAKLIHDLTREVGPLIAVNWAGLSGSLIESELFGYEKGRLQAQLAQSKTNLKQPIAARYSSMKGELELGDRMEVYLERIEQDLLRSALAINKN